MSAEKKAAELGLEFATVEPGYLNLCIRTGNLLITSGHTSDQKGVLGKDVTVEQGYAAAKDCAIKILRSVRQAHGTLDSMVPFGLGTRTRDRLQADGYPIQWAEYPMEHQVCPEEIEAVGAWLRARLA